MEKEMLGDQELRAIRGKDRNADAVGRKSD